MKRHIALLGYALGALARRRGRSVALALGLALVSGLYASGQFITESLRAEVQSTAAALPDLTVQRLVAGRPALIASDAVDALRRDPGVRSVRPRVWGYVFIPALESNIVVVASDDFLADDEAHIGSVLAERLGLRPGDRMALPSPPDGSVVLRATEIGPEDSALYDADVLRVTEATARRLLRVPEGQAVDVALTLATPDEELVVTERIVAAVPGARVLARAPMLRAYELTFDGRAGLLAVLLLPCLGGLLLLGWDRLTGLSADERREIGVLKALGWETRDVLSARIYEQSLIATSGAAAGILGAYIYVFAFGAPGLAGALLGWSALNAPLRLVPAIDLTQIAVAFVAVVVPFIGLGLVPAWRAASMDPDRSARGA